ncbi:MAG: type II toxin-antitoxin system RelE/ParE family toxin [Patescibacteria group bacterium]
MIIYTKDFLKDLDDLPKEIKKLFKKQEKIFIVNWFDARLHTKRIKELPGSFSFRITRRYRVFFYFREGETIFFKIGHRKEVYK